MKQKVHSAQSTLKKHTQEAHSHLFTSALRSVKAFRHIAFGSSWSHRHCHRRSELSLSSTLQTPHLQPEVAPHPGSLVRRRVEGRVPDLLLGPLWFTWAKNVVEMKKRDDASQTCRALPTGQQVDLPLLVSPGVWRARSCRARENCLLSQHWLNHQQTLTQQANLSAIQSDLWNTSSDGQTFKLVKSVRSTLVAGPVETNKL